MSKNEITAPIGGADNDNTTSKFSGSLGFILSAAGSAVGLGNIWRFPYLAAEYGGGIFLLTYIIVTLLFGFPIMAMEIAIGRKTSASSVSAFGKIDKRGGFIGWLNAAVTLITLPYYCVIGGWVLKYTVVFCRGNGPSTGVPGFYSTYITNTKEPLAYQAAFLIAAAVIILLGVKNGIEKANRFIMPSLIILAVAAAAYILTLPNSVDGLIYYIKPDFSKFSFKTVLAATGQMFYSLSLANGIMITYGAYLKKNVNIEKCVKKVELFDIGIAFASGLIVISSIFAFSGGNDPSLSAGAGLMFETLPRVFAAMPFGSVIGALFFVLVLFAALSSAISMLEVNVFNLMERFHFKRITAVIIMTVLIFILGIPSALGYSVLSRITPLNMTILDFFDFIGNSIATPVIALITCVFIGWFAGTKVIADEISESGRFRRQKSFNFMIKWALPVFILTVLAGALIEM